MYQYQWFLKLNGQHSMQDVLMVGKKNSCNVSKLLVHALHSNFAMDSLEIWNVMLIFRIKTGCVCVLGVGDG